MYNRGLHGLHGLIAKNLIGKYSGRRCIVGEVVWGRSEFDWQGVVVEDVILEKLFWGRCILQLLEQFVLNALGFLDEHLS